MSKHTPVERRLADIKDSLREVWRDGGWVYVEGSGEMYRVEQAQGEKLVICDRLCEEDASFIAYAPADIRHLLSINADLLEACEAMLTCCGSSENWNGETHAALKLIEAAISKARGE